MANKKCPKCGEDNPAEAVMCWACYTPLTAGAGAAMTAGAGMAGAGAATMPRTGGPIGVPGADAAVEKKPIDPRLFFVGGGLLVAAIIALFTTGVIGGSAPPTDFAAGTQTGGTTEWQTGGAMQQVPPQQSMGPSPSGPSAPSGPEQVTGPPPPSFSMISAPNPTLKTATFAIAPSQPGVSPAQAAGLARQARQQYMSNGKWTSTQIVVFSTADSGQAFRQYMNQRRGQPLNGSDFANLAGQGAWTGATIFYESIGKNERISEPAKNPKGWWGR